LLPILFSGKTSLIKRLMANSFDQAILSTVGSELFLSLILIMFIIIFVADSLCALKAHVHPYVVSNTVIKYTIIDTAGEDE
jgi:GTPase SAR1 family protein